MEEACVKRCIVNDDNKAQGRGVESNAGVVAQQLCHCIWAPKISIPGTLGQRGCRVTLKCWKKGVGLSSI